jgi:hypothetical protein
MNDHDLDSDRLAALVRGAAPSRFDDGFANRVLDRVRAQRGTVLVSALERQFVRIVPLAAAAAILLATYNWWGGHAAASSAIDAALNLPQVTLSSAYSSTALYGAANAAPENP